MKTFNCPNILYSAIKLLLPAALLLMSSCVDETFPDDTPDTPSLDGDYMILDLQGFIGIRISNTGSMSSRADDTDNKTPSDNATFDDGYDAEYNLAEGDHHFVIIYKADQNNGKPLAVIPIDLDNARIDLNTGSHGSNPLVYDNITFSISRVLTYNNYGLEGFKNNVLKGNEAYVLLNFDSSQIYTEGTTANINKSGSNASNLFALTREEFLSLPLNDYKITVKNSGNVDTDYFTMSTSVYADSDGSLVRDYNIDETKVFDTQKAAEDDPAISAHVERLAVKYTVNFTAGSFKDSGQTPGVGNGTESDDEDESFNKDGYYQLNANGMPEYSVWINHYTDYTYTQQGYSVNSEPARAIIEIIGYYVNNTERSSYALKKLTSSTNYFKPEGSSGTMSWTDPSNRRSYWSEDPNYKFESETYSTEEAEDGTVTTRTRTKGYPHQFRQALESDSVVYYHGVDRSDRVNYTGYKYTTDPYQPVNRRAAKRDADGNLMWDENGNLIVEDKKFEFFSNIGEYDYTVTPNANCVLKYWSFEEMKESYNKIKKIDEDNADGKNSKPFYSLENTYYDPGMAMGSNPSFGTMIWNWSKAAYSAATNLTVLARMRVINNYNEARTVYRGQNNVFYYYLHGPNSLLDSKLKIFNEVILSQGNAGINILHGYFASHGFLRTGEDSFGDTNLDKVGWNIGSVLWIADVEDNGYENWCREAVEEDLTLIPAEISGGDGQCLIAPERMGANVKFYLAPVLRNEDGIAIGYDGKPVTDESSYVRDINKSVEISFNHLVALIHKGIGPIDVFTDGYMYYSLPIPHRVTHINDMNSKTNPTWKTLGNIGVVRNNWYNITVSNITDVGTPVHSPEQPIVPVMDVKRSYINANVTVYGWHNISQGGVPMQ